MDHEIEFQGGKFSYLIGREKLDTDMPVHDGERFGSRLLSEEVSAQVVFPFKRNALRLGAEWSRAELGFSSGMNPSAEGGVDSQERYSLYFEDFFQVGDAFKLVAGMRLDDYAGFDRRVTRRLYGNYRIDSYWSLGAGFSQNYRAPSLRQTNGAYCGSIFGYSAVQRGVLCGNPDLNAEKSINEEVSIHYEGVGGQAFGLTLFNNKVEDKIVRYNSGQVDLVEPSRSVYLYENLDRLSLRGAEFSAMVPLGMAWRINGNYTYTDSRNRGKDRLPVEMVPEHAANLRAEWSPNRILSAYVNVNYLDNFRSSAADAQPRKASTTFDLGGGYQLTRSLALNLAMLNLTDRTTPLGNTEYFDPLDGNWVGNEGRRYWLSATYSF